MSSLPFCEGPLERKKMSGTRSDTTSSLANASTTATCLSFYQSKLHIYKSVKTLFNVHILYIHFALKIFIFFERERKKRERDMERERKRERGRQRERERKRERERERKRERERERKMRMCM